MTPSKIIISIIALFFVSTTAYTQGVNISKWKLIQTNAAGAYEIPDGTIVPVGGYVIIARNATKSSFEAFWGKKLDSSCVYLNTADFSGGAPKINGSETFSLQNAASEIVDGPTYGLPATLSGRTIYQRKSASLYAGASDSWTVASTVTFGTEMARNVASDPVICEIGDDASSGGYNYEYVQIYCGSTATPFAPALASPSNGAIGISITPLLVWNGIRDSASYRLQVATDSNFGNIVINQSEISANSYTSDSLADNTLYYWRVNATSAAGTSAWSQIWNFSTGMNKVSLIAPMESESGLVNPIRFTWTKALYALAYSIQISTDNTFTTTEINSSTSDTSYSTSALNSSTAYYWRVRAENMSGASAWSSAKFITKLDTPTLLSPGTGAVDVNLKPTLSWGSVLQGARYVLQLSDRSDFGTILRSIDTSTTTIKLDSLERGTMYWWRVRAYNGGDTTGYTNSNSFTTIPNIPSTPALLMPFDASTNNALNVVLRWSKIQEAASYRLQISSSPLFTNIIRDTICTDTLYRPSPLFSANTQLFWRVLASNAAGISAFSPASRFVTGTELNTARVSIQNINLGAVDAGSTLDTVVTITNTGNDDLLLSPIPVVTSNWSNVNVGDLDNEVYNLMRYGADLYALTKKGIYRSNTNGVMWSPINSGLPGNVISSFHTLAIAGKTLFAGTYTMYDSRIFISTNNGETWAAAANNGFPKTTIQSLTVTDSGLYAGTMHGIYRSTDNGSNWYLSNTGIEGLTVTSFALTKSKMFAATNGGGVYSSADHGLHWNQAGLVDKWVNTLVIDGDSMYAGTNASGVYRSTDNGNSWTSMANYRSTRDVYALKKSGFTLFEGLYEPFADGVFYWDKNEALWTPVNNGLSLTYVYSLESWGPTLFAVAGSKLYKTGITNYSSIFSQTAISPGASATISLHFSPIPAGPYNDKLIIASNASPGVDTVDITGFGATHGLSLNNKRYDIGSAQIGKSKYTDIAFQSSGNSNLVITGITSTNPSFTISQSTLTVEASKSGTVAIGFNPTKLGADSARIIITSNAPSSPDTVFVSGISPRPVIAPAESCLSFGEVGRNTQKTLSIKIADSSLNVLVIDSIYTRTSSFTVNKTAASIAASDSIVVTFSPQATGAFADTLYLRNNSSTPLVKIPLSGNVPIPGIAITTTRLEFPPTMLKDSSALSLIVKNASLSNLNISSIATGSARFSSKQTAPLVVNGVDSTTLQVVFKPSTFGTFNDTLAIDSDAGMVKVPLTGNSPFPTITPGVASVQFGDITKGGTDVVKLRITNTSINTLLVDTIYTTTSQFTPNVKSASINDSLEFAVSFTPDSTRSFIDTLYLRNNSETPLVKIPLSGNSPAPKLAVSQASLTLGPVALVDTAVGKIMLYNSSPVNTMTVSKLQHKMYTFWTSESLPLVIAPKDSASITVKFNINSFTPSGYGNWRDTLTIVSDGGTIRIPMWGFSPRPTMQFSNRKVEFGEVGLYDSSKITIKVTNTSVNRLSIDSLRTLTSTFRVSPSSCAVSNGDTVSIVVTIKPVKFGIFTDTLFVRNNSDTLVVKIPLSGTTPSSTIAVNPASLAFGSVKNGETRQLIFGITNSSISVLQIDSLWTKTNSFNVTHMLAYGQIRKGDTTKVSIRFTPGAIGSYVDTMYIANNSILSPLKVPLNGNGVLTSVSLESDLIPVEYSLSQNFPNPFNPSTTIKFALPKESNVTLKVYDIVGREVATLVNDQLTAGYYHYSLNASKLASGMYIYRITAVSGDKKQTFTDVKKLLLTK